jgi:hypothetical protein
MHPAFLPRHRLPHLPRTPAVRRWTALVAALACALVFLPVVVGGQKSAPPSQPKITPLVTDTDDFALSPYFGHATGYSINQAGDFAFSPDGGALFVRRAGSSVATPLLYMGGEAPGYPGTRADLLAGYSINAVGQVAFEMDFFPPLGIIRHAIYVHDGSGFHVVADSADIAPGTGGRTFGRGLTRAAFNDAGQVGILATLVAVTGTQPPENTLFLTTVGGPTVRIAGQGDPAPGTGGGNLTSIGSSGMNAAGELLFTAVVDGGSGGRGLFMGSTAGVRKVVSHGDPLPAPLVGSFDLSAAVPSRFMSRSGQVAFAYQGRIFVDTPGADLALVVNPGDPIAGLPGVTIGTSSMLAFNDAGQIALTAGLTGLGFPAGNFGLVRYTPASGLELVAYRTLAAPGAGGARFNNFAAASLNAAGLMTFQSNLASGTIPRGFFQQSPGAAPVKLVLEGETTPLAGGGTFGLGLSNATTTLADGAAVFHADVLDGAACAGTFLARGTAISSLTSTEDRLPAGTRVSLRTFTVGVGGNLVVFCASRTGGQPSLWFYDMRTGKKTRIVADGDPIPGIAGRLRIGTTSVMLVNNAGEVAFGARLVGGPGYPGSGIFLRTRTGTLQKIVAQGDVDHETGRTFTGIGWNGSAPRPLNDAGQFVFRATLTGSPTPNPVGVFVGAPGANPVKVTLSGEPAPLTPATTFSSFGSATINNAGVVAFQANAADGRQGLYVALPGSVPAKIAASLDAGPSGSTFPAAMPTQFAFNDRTEVAFMTPLIGGPGGGVFVGTPGTLISIALNGNPAPTGGNFAIDSASASLHMNNAGDLVFRTGLTGGSADSGLFLIRKADGVRRTIALQGQPAPGGGVFQTLYPSLNNVPGENCALAANGEAWLSFYPLLSRGDYAFTFFRFTKDNVLERVFARGDKAPQSNGGDLLGATQVYPGSADTSGRYYFAGYIAGGKVSSAIYVTR